MSATHSQTEKTVGIQELYAILKKYMVLIIIAGLLGGVVTYCICNYLVDPVYRASAKMIVNSREEQVSSITNDQLTSAQNLVDTYAIIIRSQPVLDPVIETLGLQLDFEKLAQKVSVTSVNNTQVMEIAVESSNQEQARMIVAEIVRICPKIIIDAVEAGSVKTIEPAHIQSEPVGPHTNLFTLLAAFLCMFAVVVVAIACHVLDNTYKSETELLNDLEWPVLGVIPDYECCMKNKTEVKEGKYNGKA